MTSPITNIHKLSLGNVLVLVTVDAMVHEKQLTLRVAISYLRNAKEFGQGKLNVICIRRIDLT